MYAQANRNPSHAAFGEYLEDEFPPEQHAELREMKRAYIDGRAQILFFFVNFSDGADGEGRGIATGSRGRNRPKGLG